MSGDDAVLAQYLGEDEFPVTWESDQEQDLFWVYDDLHCPHPLSPMYFDIGGWWLTCDHMFRRFGTPFAVDWLAKNVNGYLYTAAIPADPDLRVSAGSTARGTWRASPRTRSTRPRSAPYLDGVLPVYGERFADWWRDRLVPEMLRNFEYLESQLDRADEMSRMELAVLLEDAMDVHDRHWKIHWMLNFAQLSATIKLRETVERIRGSVDEELLGRLQNSAEDRNWDSVEGLWQLKESVKADPALREAFRGSGAQIRAALEATDTGRRFIAEQRRALPAGVRLARRLEPRVHLPDLPGAAGARPRAGPRLPRHRLRLPERAGALRVDIERPPRNCSRASTGADRERDGAANAINLRHGAADARPPLLHRPGRQRPAPARAHRDRPEARRRRTPRRRRRRRVPALQRAARVHRRPVGDRRAGDRRRAPGRARAARNVQPRDWIGTATETQLDFPYLVNWGFPEQFHREAATDDREGRRDLRLTGRRRGHRPRGAAPWPIRRGAEGDILVCQMTNPAWVVLFTKIAGLVTDAGGTTSHPAVLAREFGIPAVVGTSEATRKISTGDRIRVDGTAGIVEIMGAAEPVRAALSLD